MAGDGEGSDRLNLICSRAARKLKPKAEIRWHVGRDDAKNILETFDLVFPPARLSLLQNQPPCRMTWNAEPVRRQTRGQQEVRDSALDTVSMEQP